MSDTTQKFKKQLPRNVVMAVLTFLTYSISAIWLTPYLLKHLGPAAYGLVPLAALFTQYAALITYQISGAVNRFLTIEIQKPGGKPNVVFNSSFALYLILIAIQLPFFGVAIYYADHLFSIPHELKSDVLIFLGCSAGSFLVSLLQAVFGTSLYARNRLDIMNLVRVVSLALRLILIIVCFALFGPRLRYIGYIEFLLSVMNIGIGIKLWKKITPDLHVSLRDIDMKLMIPVFHMSFWSLVSHLGTLLYQRSDIWIINRFISPVMAGQYAAVLVVSNFIKQLAELGYGQLGPVIMTHWARGEIFELRQLLSFSVKIFAFGIAIPIALICANGRQILFLWLGSEYAEFATLLNFLTIHLCINGAVELFFPLFGASNSLRIPGMVTFVMGVVNVAFSYFLGVSLGLGGIGVALATMVAVTVRNIFFAPAYASRLLDGDLTTFMRPLLGCAQMLGLVVVGCFVPFARWLGLMGEPISAIMIQTAWALLIVGIGGWYVLFNKNERAMVYGALSRKANLMLKRI